MAGTRAKPTAQRTAPAQTGPRPPRKRRSAGKQEWAKRHKSFTGELTLEEHERASGMAKELGISNSALVKQAVLGTVDEVLEPAITAAYERGRKDQRTMDLRELNKRLAQEYQSGLAEGLRCYGVYLRCPHCGERVLILDRAHGPVWIEERLDQLVATRFEHDCRS